LLIAEQDVYRPDVVMLYFHHPLCFDSDCFLLIESYAYSCQIGLFLDGQLVCQFIILVFKFLVFFSFDVILSEYIILHALLLMECYCDELMDDLASW